MSDFAIPGLGSNKYGTKELIEGLMKVERVPRDKAAARLETFKKQKTVWLDLNQRLSTLRNGSRDLYSFKNPFNERVAKSSDEAVLTATATREALEQTRRIDVKRVAEADRYLSSDLPKDSKVKPGTYTFSVGDKKLELKYGGGSLQDFADALTRKGRDLLRAQVVSVTSDTRALVIESLKTGAANRLGFQGEAETLALELGIAERTTSRSRAFDISQFANWEKPVDRKLLRRDAEKLILNTGAEAKIALNAPASSAGMVLELEYRLAKLPGFEEPTAPVGPKIGPSGSISYEGISIQGAPSDPALPPWEPPPRPPQVEDRGMAFLLAPDGYSVPLPELEDSAEPKKLRVEIELMISELAALGFRNRDTGRRLELLSARVYDPKESGGLKPKRPVSVAQDAVVAVDGVEAIRDSNEVKDLIPGVTLSLKEASEKSVRLKVEPNREAVKDALIELVGNYNRLMAQVNILSRNDENLIQEISYFSDEEKKTARERLGLFQGDSTLSLLRSNLQRIMMEPYSTRSGTAMALLSQIGIATDARRPGSGQGYDQGRLRGYLEIEESSLDAALERDFEAIRELFGRDTDGDLLMDSGVAFALDQLLKPYVETGGILNLKTRTLDQQIGSEERTIASLDQALARKEAELRQKYGMMEGALNRMEGTSKSIDNFSTQNSGGQ